MVGLKNGRNGARKYGRQKIKRNKKRKEWKASMKEWNNEGKGKRRKLDGTEIRKVQGQKEGKWRSEGK